MSERAAHAPARQAAAPQPGPKSGLRLQRKCACGRHTVGGAECGECVKKRTALQRWSNDRPSPAALLRDGSPARDESADAGPRERDFIGVDVGRNPARRTAGTLGWLAGALGTAVTGSGRPATRHGRTSRRLTAVDGVGSGAAGLDTPQPAPAFDEASHPSAAAVAEASASVPAAPAAGAPSPAAATSSTAGPTPAPAAPVASAAPASALAPRRAARAASADPQAGEERREAEEPEHEEEGFAAPPLRSFLVDDGVEHPRPEQMRREEFLARLQADVTRAAEEALAGTGRNTDGCPYLRFWFAYYGGRGSRQIERALRRYAPGAAAARSAADYIAVVVERVRGAVETWARTGEVTGVPDELQTAALLRGSATAPAHAFGPVLLKAREGVARPAEDPAAVRAELGEGRPLDTRVRLRMEGAFGRGFAGVRMHTGATAARLAREQNARAFAVGSHVAFAAGEYRPGTVAGDALIAHELAHTVQQEGATAAAPAQEAGSARQATLEGDADRAAAGVVGALWGGAKDAAAGVAPALRSGLRLSRCSTSKCPTQVEVVRLHPVPLTADHVGRGWRTGWGAVAEMKVSDAAGTDFDGIFVHENLSPSTNTCGTVPNCTNQHGAGGSGGARFEVGARLGPSVSGPAYTCGPDFLQHSLTFPGRKNTFYDCHLAAFGNSKLHELGLASCTQTCSQFYDCRGTPIGQGTFTITREFTRGVIGGVDVTNITLSKA